MKNLQNPVLNLEVLAESCALRLFNNKLNIWLHCLVAKNINFTMPHELQYLPGLHGIKKMCNFDVTVEYCD